MTNEDRLLVDQLRFLGCEPMFDKLCGIPLESAKAMIQAATRLEYLAKAYDKEKAKNKDLRRQLGLEERI